MKKKLVSILATATMLASLITTIPVSVSAATTEVDPLLGVIRLKDKDGEQYSYTIKDDTKVRFEGEKITADDIVVGYEGVITTKNGALFSIDFITPDVEESFKASISSITKNAIVSGSSLFILCVKIFLLKQNVFTFITCSS